MGQTGRFRLKGETLILGGTVAVLLVIVAFPLLLLFASSLWQDGRFTLENFIQVFSARRNYTALLNTLKLGAATALCSVLLGAPAAWLVTRTNLPGARIFRTLFMVPYMIPPFIGAIGWSQLLNRRNGFINNALLDLLGLPASPFDINTMGGLIWVMSLYLFPFVFITAAGALERMDPTLEEAARTSGARTLTIMRHITLPLVAPSIAGGALLAFASAIANFGIPALIGMQGRVYVVTTMIYSYLHSGGFNGIMMASALSVMLLALSVGALLANNLYLRRRRFTLIAGKSMRPQVADLQGWKVPALLAAALVVAVTVVLPLSSIVASSFLKAWGVELTLANLTLKNYRYILFEYDLTRAAMRNSFLLAAGAAMAAMVLGSLVAYISVKTRLRGRKALEMLAIIPYTIPGTVVAIAMMLAWSGRYGVNLYNTFWIILVAYVAHYVAYSVRTTSASLQQIHSSLEEVARVSGGTWVDSFRDVVLPLIRPGLIAGWFLIFMPTLRELTISILLWGPRTATVGVAIFEMQEAGYNQISAAFSTLLLAVVLLGNWAVKRLTRGKFGI